MEKARAVDSYRAVHAALAAALVAGGQAAVLKERCEPAADADEAAEDGEGELAGCTAAKGPTVCFTRPELYDVVDPVTGAKIAGAAQEWTEAR
jgi:lipoate-protein ligase A